MASVIEYLDEYKALKQERQKLKKAIDRGKLNPEQRSKAKDRLYQIKLQIKATPAIRSHENGMFYVAGEGGAYNGFRLCGHCKGVALEANESIEWGEGFVPISLGTCSRCMGTGIDVAVEPAILRALRDIYVEGLLDGGATQEEAEVLVDRKFADIDPQDLLD